MILLTTQPQQAAQISASLTPSEILERISQNADIRGWIVAGARDGRLAANSKFNQGPLRVFRGSAAWLDTTNTLAESAEDVGVKVTVDSMQVRYTLPLSVCADPVTLILKSGSIRGSSVRVNNCGELTQAFVGQQNQPVCCAQLNMFTEEELSAISETPTQRIVLLVMHYRAMAFQQSSTEYLDLYLAYPMNFNATATKIPFEAILQLPSVPLTYQAPAGAPVVINVLPELGEAAAMDSADGSAPGEGS